MATSAIFAKAAAEAGSVPGSYWTFACGAAARMAFKGDVGNQMGSSHAVLPFPGGMIAFPPGGNAIMPPGKGKTAWLEPIWFPTSPLKAIRAAAPHANVQYDPGTDPASAAALAKMADVAIGFAYQWESEGMDLDSLSLPEHQDDLIVKVAAANPHTIVVLETGSPVTMPWAEQGSGIL